MKPQVEYNANSTSSNRLFQLVEPPRSARRLLLYGGFIIMVWMSRLHKYITAAYYSLYDQIQNTIISLPNRYWQHTVNIIIVSDLGNNTNRNDKPAIDTITALAETANSTSFYLRVDNISYAYDPIQLSIEFYEATWNTFQEDMEIVTEDNIQSDLPGNHEVTCNPSEKLDYEND